MIITCPQCAAEYHVNADLFGVGARPVQCTACGRQWLQPPPGEAVGAVAADDKAVAAAVPPPAAGAESPPVTIAAAAAETAAAAEQPAGAVPTALGDSASVVNDSAAQAMAEAAQMVPAAAATDAAEADPLLDLAQEPPLAAPHRPWLVMAMAALATLLACVALLLLLQRPILAAIPEAAVLYRLFGLAPAPAGSGLSLRDVTSLREWTGSEELLIVSGTVVNVVSDRRAVPMLRIALVDLNDNELQDVVVAPQRETLAPGEKMQFEARIAAPMAEARRMVVGFAATAPGAPQP
jgi:predicted Zn finger-like uncharacterized protein